MMKKIKRTKRETRINNRKDSAYSSLYSIISFIATLVYLIADIAFDNLTSAIIAFAILNIIFFACKISVRKLSKILENEDERSKKICKDLSKYSQLIGYLTYCLRLHCLRK